MKLRLYAVVIVLLAAACATAPTGRRQFIIVPDEQMEGLGTQAFAEIRNQVELVDDPAINRYVGCIASQVIGVVDGAENLEWELAVLDEPSVNAFALPGGKIGIHRGMLAVADDPDELATVIAHEVSHVLSRHGSERISQQLAVEGGLAAVGGMMEDARRRQVVVGLLGAGATLGVLLPYSRTHEAEADEVGLLLMAQAGFDPRKSVALWRDMAETTGPQPPAFLSTHPPHGQRIENLQEDMDEAMRLYSKSLQAGRVPSCPPPPQVDVEPRPAEGQQPPQQPEQRQPLDSR